MHRSRVGITQPQRLAGRAMDIDVGAADYANTWGKSETHPLLTCHHPAHSITQTIFGSAMLQRSSTAVAMCCFRSCPNLSDKPKHRTVSLRAFHCRRQGSTHSTRSARRWAWPGRIGGERSCDRRLWSGRPWPSSCGTSLKRPRSRRQCFRDDAIVAGP